MSSPVIPPMEVSATRLPPWIRAPLPRDQYPRVRTLLATRGLTTVCREAHCPNLPECWSSGTATLMLLGETCTRRCRFCAVTTRSPGGITDPSEPRRVAEAIREWGLRYVVLTMVCRDDLADQGADLLAETVRRVRHESPGTRIELLTGDLGGQETALREVLDARPDVLAHNVETVRRLTPAVRDRRATYDRSLSILRAAKRSAPGPILTKSSLMLGLGEEEREILETLRDLREAQVDLVTLGQYLQPRGNGFFPVDRYIPPEEFAQWEERARALGFRGAVAGPMVRSSYRADELYEAAISQG